MQVVGGGVDVQDAAGESQRRDVGDGKLQRRLCGD